MATAFLRVSHTSLSETYSRRTSARGSLEWYDKAKHGNVTMKSSDRRSTMFFRESGLQVRLSDREAVGRPEGGVVPRYHAPDKTEERPAAMKNLRQEVAG